MMTETDTAPPPIGVELAAAGGRPAPRPVSPRTPADLGPLLDVPVTVSAVLGRVRVPVGDLLAVGPGTVLELDRKVGDAIEIRVNDRLVARGEVVLVHDRLGVTLTEIVKPASGPNGF